MALVKPFRGVRYDLSKVEHLASVLSPPYDVINHDAEQKLLERNPYNIIRVELSHAGAEGQAPAHVYEDAARTLEEWLQSGVLITESEPALYVYGQKYVGPDGKERERKGFFARVRLERPDEGGAVRPHETTLGGPKADRLRLLTATRANISPIFGLFDDPSGEAAALLDHAVAREPDASDTDSQQIEHRLWVVRDQEAIDRVTAALTEQRIYIADGHHRYETALNYQRERRAQNGDGSGEAPYDYVMMYLADLRDPGLAIFPIHRAVQLPRNFDSKAFFRTIEQWFHVERADIGQGPPAAARLTAQIAELADDGQRALGLYGGEAHGGGYVLRARGDALDAELAAKKVPPPLAGLDITVLHEILLPQLGASFENDTVHFIHDATEAIDRVDQGDCDLAFLLNATRIDDLVDVVDGGLTMPQKSTFFYPKPATGLVLNRLG